MPSRASIVIPAYNEETRIRGLLDTLSDPLIRGAYDVYVVCNGCTDRTRQVAEEYAGVVAVEIDGAGKYLALNEGDRLAGDVYPRLYCDADLRLSPSSIIALVEALTTEEVKVAAPRVRYAVEESTWMVRMYFRALESPVITRWHSEHLVGRGLYGASRAARRRFESFPALFADDLFFDSQFGSTEKVIPPDAIATVWVPVNLRQLIRGEVRVASGNRRYRAAERGEGGITDHAATRRDRFELRLGDRITALRRWRRDLRGVDLVPVFVYLVIVAAARTTLAAKKLAGRQVHWR
jgi:glycosyltransferase involved in cell wall biosynthesis